MSEKRRLRVVNFRPGKGKEVLAGVLISDVVHQLKVKSRERAIADMRAALEVWDVFFDARDGVEPVAPPALAEFLLRLCARSEKQQAALGDLNEVFERNCAEYGQRRATRLYWADALRSLGPLLWRMIARFFKWAVVADLIQRHF